MNQDQFWQFIDQSRANANGDLEELHTALDKKMNSSLKTCWGLALVSIKNGLENTQKSKRLSHR
jgi:hypothetical protein